MSDRIEVDAPLTDTNRISSVREIVQDWTLGARTGRSALLAIEALVASPASTPEKAPMTDRSQAERDAARLARIRRSAEASMACTDPRFRQDCEELFRVADVLWLLSHVNTPPGPAVAGEGR